MSRVPVLCAIPIDLESVSHTGRDSRSYCMPTALTIAGSDSGGGAGIQADLKTFAAHGVYGTSRHHRGHRPEHARRDAWQAVPTDLVTAQIEAVAGDIGADAVKIGMLANAAIVEAVAAAIAELDLPARRRRSGDGRQGRRPAARGRRRRRDAGRAAAAGRTSSRRTCRKPKCWPGCRSARSTTCGAPADGSSSSARASYSSRAATSTARNRSTSRARHDGHFELRRPRIETPHTHGTGCTLSSAIAANLALGPRRPRRPATGTRVSRRRDPPRARARQRPRPARPFLAGILVDGAELSRAERMHGLAGRAIPGLSTRRIATRITCRAARSAALVARDGRDRPMRRRRRRSSGWCATTTPAARVLLARLRGVRAAGREGLRADRRPKRRRSWPDVAAGDSSPHRPGRRSARRAS